MARYLIILLISLLSQSLFCQKINFSKSIGTKAIAVSAIIQNKAYGAELAFEKRIEYQLNYCLGLNYFKGAAEHSDFIVYGLENSVNYEFINLNDKLILASGAKLNMGLEEISSKEEEKTINKFMIGAGLIVRADLYLSKKVSAFIAGSYNLNFKSEIYKNNFRLNAGIKLILL